MTIKERKKKIKTANPLGKNATNQRDTVYYYFCVSQIMNTEQSSINALVSKSSLIWKVISQLDYEDLP